MTLSPREIAEVLWLRRLRGPVEPSASEPTREDLCEDPPARTSPSPPRQRAPKTEPDATSQVEAGIGAEETTPGGGAERLRLSLPRPLPLRDRRALARGLHRLASTRESPSHQELDVEATVRASAAADDIRLELRPRREPGIHLVIVEDRSASMTPWRDLCDRVVELAQEVGSFAGVSRGRIGGGSELELRRLVRPGLDNLVLLVSDGVSHVIRGGALAQALAELPSGTRIAWLHPWTRGAWRRTPADRLRLGRLRPGQVDPSEIRLPLVELSPEGIRPLESWAHGRGAGSLLARRLPRRERPRREREPILDWVEHAHRFARGASPESLELLALAASVPGAAIDHSLLVALGTRLVGEARLTRLHIAEAITSGMLRRVELGDRPEPLLVFADEDAKASLRSFLRPERIAEVLEWVIEAGQAEDFPSDLRVPVDLLIRIREDRLDEGGAAWDSGVLSALCNVLDAAGWDYDPELLRPARHRATTPARSPFDDVDRWLFSLRNQLPGRPLSSWSNRIREVAAQLASALSEPALMPAKRHDLSFLDAWQSFEHLAIGARQAASRPDARLPDPPEMNPPPPLPVHPDHGDVLGQLFGPALRTMELVFAADLGVLGQWFEQQMRLLASGLGPEALAHIDAVCPEGWEVLGGDRFELDAVLLHPTMGVVALDIKRGLSHKIPLAPVHRRALSLAAPLVRPRLRRHIRAAVLVQGDPPRLHEVRSDGLRELDDPRAWFDEAAHEDDQLEILSLVGLVRARLNGIEPPEWARCPDCDGIRVSAGRVFVEGGPSIFLVEEATDEAEFSVAGKSLSFQSQKIRYEPTLHRYLVCRDCAHHWPFPGEEEVDRERVPRNIAGRPPDGLHGAYLAKVLGGYDPVPTPAWLTERIGGTPAGSAIALDDEYLFDSRSFDLPDALPELGAGVPDELERWRKDIDDFGDDPEIIAWDFPDPSGETTGPALLSLLQERLHGRLQDTDTWSARGRGQAVLKRRRLHLLHVKIHKHHIAVSLRSRCFYAHFSPGLLRIDGTTSKSWFYEEPTLKGPGAVVQFAEELLDEWVRADEVLQAAREAAVDDPAAARVLGVALLRSAGFHAGGLEPDEAFEHPNRWLETSGVSSSVGPMRRIVHVEEGERWLRRAIDEGDAEAAEALGLHALSVCGEIGPEETKELLLQASEAGRASASAALAGAHDRGDIEDDRGILHWLHLAGLAGVASARERWAHRVLDQAAIGVTETLPTGAPELAVEWLEDLAEEDQEVAARLLIRQLHGFGVEPRPEAAERLRALAENDDGIARALAMRLAAGCPGLSADPEEARSIAVGTMPLSAAAGADRQRRWPILDPQALDDPEPYTFLFDSPLDFAVALLFGGDALFDPYFLLRSTWRMEEPWWLDVRALGLEPPDCSALRPVAMDYLEDLLRSGRELGAGTTRGLLHQLAEGGEGERADRLAADMWTLGGPSARLGAVIHWLDARPPRRREPAKGMLRELALHDRSAMQELERRLETGDLEPLEVGELAEVKRQLATPDDDIPF